MVIFGKPVSLMHFLACAYILVVCVFLVAPLLVVVPLSFSSGTMLVLPVPGYSLRWYQEVFASTTWLIAFRNSIVIGIGATALATVLGTLAAMGLAKAAPRVVSLVSAIALVPLIMPVVIVAVAVFYAFASLGLTQSLFGIVLAHAALGVPFVFVMVTSALKGLDPTLPRAGLALGGSPWHVFRTVTLPLIAPGMTTGALFAFATSFDELVVVLFLASPTQRTLPREIFAGIRDNISPAIAAVAVIMMILSTILMLLAEWQRRRSEKLRTAGLTH